MILSSRCGVLRREISPSRMSMCPCLTGRTRFLFGGAMTGSGLILSVTRDSEIAFGFGGVIDDAVGDGG